MKHNIEKTSAVCFLCPDAGKTLLYTVQEHEYPDTTDDDFYFFGCDECGLVMLDPRPSEMELETIYPANYFAFDLGNAADGSNGLTVKSVSGFFERRRTEKLLSTYLSGALTSVLDIGCGDGSDLDLLRRIAGDDLKTVGIEVAKNAADRARLRGHRIFEGSFPSESVNIRDNCGKFSLVLSKHVIEHVASPVSFLQSVRSLVEDDGLVVIDTPNVSSPLRFIFGKHWGGWHTPRHWYLFDPRTIRLLARRCDLDVVEVKQMPINTFWSWGLHSLLFKKHRRMADRLFDPANSGKAGIAGIAMLGIFQVLELILKLATRRTSQMRVIMRPLPNV